MITPEIQRLIDIAEKIGDNDMARELKANTRLPAKIETTEAETERWLKEFITEDPEMLEMKDTVRKLAKVEDSVLILGESGTGKELIAKALHGNRKRFVAINCTSLPDYLLESELFGHVKGSFTGALTDKEGLFQFANGGTLFLDEIGDMPMGLQCKLLRVLENKSIRRVGANAEIPINCRVIAATNQNISKLREDLYWRLSTFEIKLSPIRLRYNDAYLIVDKLSGSHDNTLKILRSDTPIVNSGNVRELQQLVRRWEVLKKNNIPTPK